MSSIRGATQRYVPYPPFKPHARNHGVNIRATSVQRRTDCSEAQSALLPAVVSPTIVGSTINDFWSRIPLPLLAALAKGGIDSAAKLREAPAAAVLKILPWQVYTQYEDLLSELRRPEGSSVFSLFRVLAKYPAPPGSLQIGDLAPAVGSARASRATPSSNVSALQQLKRQGWDPRAVCDAVADARANAGVRPSSANTYDSHLRGVEFVCGVLAEAPLPASLATIRRVSSVVGNPSTLRGWLAAWRRLHLIARLPWAGDRDPFLLAVRAGLRHNIGPTPPKKRCRRGTVRRLAAAATQQHLWEVGAFCVLAYIFALRVPSELVRQAKPSLFNCKGARIAYGPIQRKGKSDLQTLRRWCTCDSDPLLCPHPWIEILSELRPSGCCFTKPVAHYMQQVVGLLRGLQVRDAELHTSHCFRRGAGVDVLETHGLRAMLEHGQWSTPRAAEPYASADEQTAQAMGVGAIEFSDDEG